MEGAAPPKATPFFPFPTTATATNDDDAMPPHAPLTDDGVRPLPPYPTKAPSSSLPPYPTARTDCSRRRASCRCVAVGSGRGARRGGVAGGKVQLSHALAKPPRRLAERCPPLAVSPGVLHLVVGVVRDAVLHRGPRPFRLLHAPPVQRRVGAASLNSSRDDPRRPSLIGPKILSLSRSFPCTGWDALRLLPKSSPAPLDHSPLPPRRRHLHR